MVLGPDVSVIQTSLSISFAVLVTFSSGSLIHMFCSDKVVRWLKYKQTAFKINTLKGDAFTINIHYFGKKN